MLLCSARKDADPGGEEGFSGTLEMRQGLRIGDRDRGTYLTNTGSLILGSVGVLVTEIEHRRHKGGVCHRLRCLIWIVVWRGEGLKRGRADGNAVPYVP